MRRTFTPIGAVAAALVVASAMTAAEAASLVAGATARGSCNYETSAGLLSFQQNLLSSANPAAVATAPCDPFRNIDEVLTPGTVVSVSVPLTSRASASGSGQATYGRLGASAEASNPGGAGPDASATGAAIVADGFTASQPGDARFLITYALHYSQAGGFAGTGGLAAQGHFGSTARDFMPDGTFDPLFLSFDATQTFAVDVLFAAGEHVAFDLKLAPNAVAAQGFGFVQQDIAWTVEFSGMDKKPLVPGRDVVLESGWTYDTIPPLPAVPEPSTWLTMLLGGAALTALRRRVSGSGSATSPHPRSASHRA